MNPEKEEGVCFLFCDMDNADGASKDDIWILGQANINRWMIIQKIAEMVILDTARKACENEDNPEAATVDMINKAADNYEKYYKNEFKTNYIEK